MNGGSNVVALTQPTRLTEGDASVLQHAEGCFLQKRRRDQLLEKKSILLGIAERILHVHMPSDPADAVALTQKMSMLVRILVWITAHDSIPTMTDQTKLMVTMTRLREKIATSLNHAHKSMEKQNGLNAILTYLAATVVAFELGREESRVLAHLFLGEALMRTISLLKDTHRAQVYAVLGQTYRHIRKPFRGIGYGIRAACVAGLARKDRAKHLHVLLQRVTR